MSAIEQLIRDYEDVPDSSDREANSVFADARDELASLRSTIDRLQAELAEWQQKAGGYNACNIILARDIEAMRQERDTAEAEADRLRSAYDDVRALNVQIASDAATHAIALKAELADAKAALTRYGDMGAFQALRDGNVRAERAEARIAEQTSAALGMAAANEMLRNDVATLAVALERAKAHIRELNDKWADDVLRCERAEAQIASVRAILDTIRRNSVPTQRKLDQATFVLDTINAYASAALDTQEK
jgi:chromosome segregation ATPase